MKPSNTKSKPHNNMRDDSKFQKKLAGYNATGKVETIIYFAALCVSAIRLCQGFDLDNYVNKKNKN